MRIWLIILMLLFITGCTSQAPAPITTPYTSPINTNPSSNNSTIQAPSTPTFTSPNPKDSSSCSINMDCQSVSGCINGCFNKDNLPTQPDEICKKNGPSDCKCIDNTCVNANINTVPCNSYLCMDQSIARIDPGDKAVFVAGMNNNNIVDINVDLNINQIKAEDNNHNPIDYTLIPIMKNGSITLNSSQTFYRIITINTTKMTPSGNYLFNVSIKGPNKNITGEGQFYLKVY